MLQDRIKRQEEFNSKGEFKFNQNNFIDQLLPGPKDMCYKKPVLDAKSKYCYFPFKDLATKSLVHVVDKDNKVVKKFRADYDHNKELIELGNVDLPLKEDLVNHQQELYELQNPEVEVVFIYGNHKNTDLVIEFKKNNLEEKINGNDHDFL